MQSNKIDLGNDLWLVNYATLFQVKHTFQVHDLLDRMKRNQEFHQLYIDIHSSKEVIGTAFIHVVFLWLQRDLEGLTPLITAASSGHLAAVQVLCSAGCDLDERNNEGRTALMEATSGGHLDVLRHLVQAGCHVNVMDCHGVTALADAAAGDSVVAVEELIAAGADTDEQDSRGRTPLHVATLYGHREVADRLVRARCSLDTQVREGVSWWWMKKKLKVHGAVFPRL